MINVSNAFKEDKTDCECLYGKCNCTRERIYYPSILEKDCDNLLEEPGFFHEEFLRNQPKNDYFLIREPFNNTYNPAKNIKADRPATV